MARINIEESWWSDVRRNKLIKLFKGDARLADGLMVQVWRLSQGFENQSYLIPYSQFKCVEDHALLFECDLAEFRDEKGQKIQGESKRCLDGAWTCLVYVKGSEKNHAWLVNNRGNASQGGKKSALRERDERGRLLPKTPSGVQAALGVDPSDLQATSKRVQASSSSSSSSSPSKGKNTIVGIRVDYPREFDDLWVQYGRRGDKKAAHEVYRDCKLTPAELGDLAKAIKNYCYKTPEHKFRKHFERFLKVDWREWITLSEGNGLCGITVEEFLKGETHAIVDQSKQA